MEMANGIAAGQDTGLSNPGLTSVGNGASQDAPMPSPASTQDRSERTYSKAEVTEIVKRAKGETLESYRRLASEQPEYARQKFGDLPESSGNNNGFQEENIKRVVADTMRGMRDEWAAEQQQKWEAEQANKIVNNFWNKVNPAKEKYSDFDQVVQNMGLGDFTQTVQLLADHVDNAGDVLYALGKDMGKLATLEGWAAKYPQVAISEVRKLSQSLKDNESASKVRVPNEPLSQIQPRNVGLGDGNSASVKDWRARFKSLKK